MLFSYQQATEAEGLPTHTKRFAHAATQVSSPQGLVLSNQAFQSFLDSYGVGAEVQSLIDAITDESSIERVEYEIQRRMVTGRIPDDVIEAISEAQEILSMDEKLNVSDIPLVAVLSTDHPIGQMPVIINIVGKKALADAIRTLWSRAFKYPYPNGIPACSIVLYRMPPAHSTVSVDVSEKVHVNAVQGWGRFVQASEISDEFILSEDGNLISKDVRNQDKMVYRNPRTGEVVQTAVSEPSNQTITDDQSRTFTLQTIRVGCSQAVFGIGETKSWLMSVGDATHQQTLNPDVLEPEVQEESEEVYQEDPEIEIVELDDEPADPEPSVEIEPADPEPVFDDPMRGPADEPSQPSTVHGSYEKTMVQAEVLLDHVYSTIEKILRGWLHGDQPDAFDELVNRVSSKRTVPYKNRLLTLHEMKSQGAFSSPSPEAVRFGLETLVRFKNEF
jgi:hypothetical protein